MDAQGAQELLGEVSRARRRALARQPGVWFPLVLFGVLSLLSLAVIVPAGPAWLGVYWPVAGIGGGLATGVFYHRRGRQLGFEARPWPQVATAAAMVLGAVLVGSLAGDLGAELVAAIGPLLVVSAGLLVFARLIRHGPLAAFALGTAVLCGAAAAGLGAADWLHARTRP